MSREKLLINDSKSNNSEDMSNKQIEEMAKVYDNARLKARDTLGSMNEGEEMWYSKAFYNAGYRRQNEGHWFILEYEYFTCSECGYYHPNGCDSTKEAKEKLADGKVPKYCSECGAKMKGGAE